MIYIWRDKKLAKDLHDGIVTEKQQATYLASYLFIMAFFATTFVSSNLYHDLPPPNLYDYIIDIITVGFSVLMVVICYNVNNKGDQKDIVTRYICLSLPIIIKGMILAFILSIPTAALDIAFAAYYDGNINFETATDAELFENYSTGPFLVSTIVLVHTYVFWRYRSSFKIASGQKEYN